MQEEMFIELVRAGVVGGCAVIWIEFCTARHAFLTFALQLFIVNHNCIDTFLYHYRNIHDFIEQRYHSKYLIVIGGEGGFTEAYVNELFAQKIMFEGKEVG